MNFPAARQTRLLTRALFVLLVAWQSMACTSLLAKGRLSGSTQGLPRNVVETLENVARQAGIDSLKITSADRTVAKQAQLMFAMMRCTGRRCDGIARVRSDYCAIAGLAIDDLENNPDWNDSKSGQAVFEQALEKRLREAGNGRSCMMHVVGPDIAPKNFAVDIAPSTLSRKQRCALLAALVNQPSIVKQRLFVPSDTAAECPGSNALGTERAIHVEFVR